LDRTCKAVEGTRNQCKILVGKPDLKCLYVRTFSLPLYKIWIIYMKVEMDCSDFLNNDFD